MRLLRLVSGHDSVVGLATHLVYYSCCLRYHCRRHVMEVVVEFSLMLIVFLAYLHVSIGPGYGHVS